MMKIRNSIGAEFAATLLVALILISAIAMIYA